MKQQVFYIHGGESFINQSDFIERLKTAPLWHMEVTEKESNKKWSGSLAEDLGQNFEVIMPPMPNKQNAKFAEWSIWFERHFAYLHDGVVLMGCSLGAMFLAKYLTLHTLPFQPKAVFLMAGAYGLPGFADKDCGDFLIEPEKVAIACEPYKTVIFHSKDDPVVPFEHAEALNAAMPSAELLTFIDKNHFLIPEFPELLAKLKELS